MDGNNVELNKREAMDEEEQLRLKVALDLDALAIKLSNMQPKGRLMSIVITKIEEAALWYAKLLREKEIE